MNDEQRADSAHNRKEKRFEKRAFDHHHGNHCDADCRKEAEHDYKVNIHTIAFPPAWHFHARRKAKRRLCFPHPYLSRIQINDGLFLYTLCRACRKYEKNTRS